MEKPFITADTSGIITFVNASFEKEFQWEASALVGRPLTWIIPKNLRDAHNLGFSKFMLSKKGTLLDTPLDLLIEMGTGQTVSARHIISFNKEKGIPCFRAEITLSPGAEKNE